MIWFFANNQLKFFKRFVSGHFNGCSFWNGVKGKDDWLEKKKKSMTKKKILVIKWMELKMEIHCGWLGHNQNSGSQVTLIFPLGVCL